MDNKELYKKIKLQGYRITKSRQKILDVLKKAGKYLSAEEIYLAIKSSGNNVGFTTIYRAVDSLSKAGVIRKISIMNGRASYEMINHENPCHHHHLICRNCQRVIDYSNFINEEVTLIKKLEKIVSKMHNFDIEDHMLSFTGLCKVCKTRFS